MSRHQRRPRFQRRESHPRLPERRRHHHRHPVVWTVFGGVALAALVAGLVIALRSDAPPRVAVATAVGVLLFAGIAALVLAANLSPRTPGSGGADFVSLGGDFGGGGDSGGAGTDGEGGGGDGGGGSW